MEGLMGVDVLFLLDLGGDLLSDLFLLRRGVEQSRSVLYQPDRRLNIKISFTAFSPVDNSWDSRLPLSGPCLSTVVGSCVLKKNSTSSPYPTEPVCQVTLTDSACPVFPEQTSR
jgi:hypothetical protein